MANEYEAYIPLNTIDHIQLYINAPAKTVAQIKSITGADYIINGGLYDMATFRACVHTKSDGIIWGTSSWNGRGIAWNTNDPAYVWLPAGYQNYLEGNALREDGKGIEKLNYNSAQGGYRGRSAVGIKDGCLCLYCSKDGSTAKKTPEKLRDYLTWDSAVMLDCGGSSQCDFQGNKITSTRKVQNLILVYLKSSACPYPEPATAVRKGTKGAGAKWVQWHLNKHGASLTVDGIFGGLSHAALLVFQKNNGLVADGICGALTRAKLKG